MKFRSLGRSPMTKIAFTVFTQGFLGLLSIVTGFIMPKYMGPEEYGYWQIYFFYAGYINFLGLGFNDGIVLNYAGYDLEELPYKRIRSAMRLILCYIGIITAILVPIILIFSRSDYQFINLVLAANILPTLIYCIILAIYLATNHSILYNMANLLQRIIFCVACVLFINLEITDYKTMVLSDTLARYLITILLCILGYKFLIGKADKIVDGLHEIKNTAGSGIMIMLSVIISGSIPMFGRIVIEWNETVEVYGVYSFAITLLSIILTFTNTVGIIIFPMMKRISTEKLSDYYLKFSFVFEAFVIIAFMIHIPLVFIIRNYMTDYIGALEYLPILIAMCFPLGKIQLLLFPYYKAYRLEKNLLYSNILGFLFMVAGTFTVYYITRSVFAVALVTTIIMTIYYKISELYLCKKAGIHIKLNTFTEIIMMLVFVILATNCDILVFSILYSLCILTYFLINRKKLISTIRSLQNKE